MNGRWQMRGVPKPLRYRHRGSRKLNQLTVEVLEPRQLLSTVDWISPTSGNWNVGSNWSTGTVPALGDDVVINQSGSPTITISTGTQSVHSVTASDPIAITGGSLAVAANSTISGGLAMTGGSLTASGSGISLTVTGTTTVDTANLYAQGGATLSIARLTTYTGGGYAFTSTLVASGSGSVLSLPNLATLASSTAEDASVNVQALGGGDVELPVLTQITGAVTVQSNIASSALDLPQLATFAGGTLNYSGGDLEMPLLANADGTTFQIGGGVSLSLTTVTEANQASFEVSGGSSLALPALTTYTGGGYAFASTLVASGSGSVLSLPNLATLASSTAADASVNVQALGGGDVELPALTQTTGPVQIACDGGSLDIGGAMVSTPTSATGTTINVPQLPQGITLNVGTSGTLVGTTIARYSAAISDGCARAQAVVAAE